MALSALLADVYSDAMAPLGTITVKIKSHSNPVFGIIQENLERILPTEPLLLLSARTGDFTQVDLLLKAGADPHTCCPAGVHILQLAVASKRGWSDKSTNWSLLLSLSNTIELTNAAVTALALDCQDTLRHILRTSRCDVNMATFPTGHSLVSLAKTLGRMDLLKFIMADFPTGTKFIMQSKPSLKLARNFLSPSVANFFNHHQQLSSSCPDLHSSGSSPQNSPVLLSKPFFPSYSFLNYSPH